MFDNELNACAESARAAYTRLAFREALKAAWYDAGAARDAWRVACGADGLHAGLVAKFVDVTCRAMAPITPHT